MKSSGGIRRATLFTAIVMSGGILQIPRLPLLAVFLILYAATPKKGSLHKALIPGLLCILVVVGLEAMRQDGADVIQISTRAANFLAGILLANLYYHYGRSALEDDLYYFVRWFPAQAIITTVTATLLPFLYLEVPGTNIYSFLFVFNHHTLGAELSFGLIRPDGIFWEPGVFQIYINFCLYLALFVKKNRTLAALATLGVVCTQSSTGVMVTVFLIAMFLLMRLKRGNLISAVGIAIILVPVVYYAAANFENKVQGEAKGSFLARQYDTITGLTIAWEYPWLGIGFDIDRYMLEAKKFGYVTQDIDVSVFDERRGNSNGLTQPLYSLGFILGSIFIFGLLRQKLFERRFLIGVLLALSLSTEPLVFTPFFLMLAFSGLSFGRSSVPGAAPVRRVLLRRSPDAIRPGGRDWRPS